MAVIRSYRFLGAFVKGFRFKLVFILVVFFLGVASGIYLAMPGEKELRNTKGLPSTNNPLKSNEAARTIRDGIEKCVIVSRTARVEVTRAIHNQIARQDAIESAELTGP